MFNLKIENIKTNEPLGFGTYGKVFPYKEGNDYNKWVVKEIVCTSARQMNLSIQEIVLGFNQRHDFITPVVGFKISWLDNELKIYIKMPRMKRTLADLIEFHKQNGTYISLEDIIRYFSSLLSALMHLKSQNICHRDIKPKNILLDENDTIKLSDIGAAKYVLPDSLDDSNSITGTQGYMAPEIYKATFDSKKKNYFKADLWSLGITIVELCLISPKRIKYEFSEEQILETVNENLKNINNIYEYPYGSRLSDILSKILDPEPENRIGYEQIINCFTEQGFLKSKSSAHLRSEQAASLNKKESYDRVSYSQTCSLSNSNDFILNKENKESQKINEDKSKERNLTIGSFIRDLAAEMEGKNEKIKTSGLKRSQYSNQISEQGHVNAAGLRSFEIRESINKLCTLYNDLSEMPTSQEKTALLLTIICMSSENIEKIKNIVIPEELSIHGLMQKKILESFQFMKDRVRVEIPTDSMINAELMKLIKMKAQRKDWKLVGLKLKELLQRIICQGLQTVLDLSGRVEDSINLFTQQNVTSEIITPQNAPDLSTSKTCEKEKNDYPNIDFLNLLDSVIENFNADVSFPTISKVSASFDEESSYNFALIDDTRSHENADRKNEKIHQEAHSSQYFHSKEDFEEAQNFAENKNRNEYVIPPETNKNDFVFLEKLGRGTFSSVFKVFDQCSRQFYALKKFRVKNKIFDDKFMKQEFEALSLLLEKPHPSLLKVIQLRYTPKSSFLAILEYGNGTLRDFHQFLQNMKRQWSDEDLLELFFQLDDQLQHLKEMNLCHRDIKPANIIISDDGKFKLADFGFAQQLKHQGLQTLPIVGTPAFWSPEIGKAYRAGKHECSIDPYEADLYSMKRTINSLISNSRRIGEIDELLYKYTDFKRTGRIKLYEELKQEYKIYMFDELYQRFPLPIKYEKLSRLVDSYLFDEIAEWIKMKLTEPNTWDEVVLLHYLEGKMYYQTGKYNLSLKSFKRSLKMTSDENLRGLLYSAIGKIEAKKGHYEEAKHYYLRALSIKRKWFGEQSAEVAEEYQNLGAHEMTTGNYKEALQCYIYALEILELMPGSYKQMELFIKTKQKLDPEIAKGFNYLGQAYLRVKNYSKAQSSFKKSLDIYQRIPGKCDPEVAQIYINLAILFQRSKKTTDALKYLGKAYKILQINKDQHPCLLSLINHIDMGFEKEFLKKGIRKSLQDTLQRDYLLLLKGLERKHNSSRNQKKPNNINKGRKKLENSKLSVSENSNKTEKKVRKSKKRNSISQTINSKVIERWLKYFFFKLYKGEYGYLLFRLRSDLQPHLQELSNQFEEIIPIFLEILQHINSEGKIVKGSENVLGRYLEKPSRKTKNMGKFKRNRTSDNLAIFVQFISRLITKIKIDDYKHKFNENKRLKTEEDSQFIKPNKIFNGKSSESSDSIIVPKTLNGKVFDPSRLQSVLTPAKFDERKLKADKKESLLSQNIPNKVFNEEIAVQRPSHILKSGPPSGSITRWNPGLLKSNNNSSYKGHFYPPKNEEFGSPCRNGDRCLQMKGELNKFETEKFTCYGLEDIGWTPVLSEELNMKLMDRKKWFKTIQTDSEHESPEQNQLRRWSDYALLGSSTAN